MTPWRLGLTRVLALLGLPHPVEATQRWGKAAEKGDAHAQANLGFGYHEGEGVPKDLAEALRWWRRALPRVWRSAEDCGSGPRHP